MPSAPVITFTDSTSASLASLAFGNVDAGATTSALTVLVWNNKAGGTIVSDTSQTTFTTKTFNGLDTGDTTPNGQALVTGQYLGIQCTSQGDSGFTQVGSSSNTAPIGSAAGGTGVIKGNVGGDAAYLSVRLVVPSGVAAGATQWLGRVSYLYT
jgi:hypothetical protein